MYDVSTRKQQWQSLLSFAAGATVPHGFGYLLSDQQVAWDKPAELWINCRMTHVFSLAHILHYPGAEKLAAHGVKALAESFYDQENGGWYSAINTGLAESTETIEPVAVVDARKAAYAHAFVVLAASSAKIAQIPGAEALLDLALECQNNHWWEAPAGKVYESFNRDWSETENYRGVNANMHTTEAYLAAFDATANRLWLDRAVGILEWVINQRARENQWRIPEHYRADWSVDTDYNRDKPKDPFRPYGYTPGHGLEWARLALHAGAQLAGLGEEIPAWILPAARELFNRAVADGWNCDGQPGFVYTVDDEGTAIARERMHWVLCEAIGAAECLRAALRGANGYQSAAAALSDAELTITQIDHWLPTWWEYAEQYLLESPGHWWHELDENNQPSTVTWPGKPDAYHVAQMLLLPDLPLAPTFALALQQVGRGNSDFPLAP